MIGIQQLIAGVTLLGNKIEKPTSDTQSNPGVAQGPTHKAAGPPIDLRRRAAPRHRPMPAAAAP